MIIEDGPVRYAIEDKLAHKLDLMIDRCTRQKGKQNAFLQNHGSTGEGKTNTSLVEAHYVKAKTKRDIYLFFRLESLIEFCKNNDGKIIIWDEPAFDSLSTDQLTKMNKNLIRLINTARKKRHFTIVNFTKFWKFPEDLVVDTCLGMVHMNSKNGKRPGRFVYIRQKHLEALWNGFKKSRQRLFGKLKSFGGQMPNIMEKYFEEMDITVEGTPHATYDDYERLKDLAIASIGEPEKENKEKQKYQIQCGRISALIYPITSEREMARQLKIDPSTIRGWQKYAETDEKA